MLLLCSISLDENEGVDTDNVGPPLFVTNQSHSKPHHHRKIHSKPHHHKSHHLKQQHSKGNRHKLHEGTPHLSFNWSNLSENVVQLMNKNLNNKLNEKVAEETKRHNRENSPVKDSGSLQETKISNKDISFNWEKFQKLIRKHPERDHSKHYSSKSSVTKHSNKAMGEPTLSGNSSAHSSHLFVNWKNIKSFISSELTKQNKDQIGDKEDLHIHNRRHSPLVKEKKSTLNRNKPSFDSSQPNLSFDADSVISWFSTTGIEHETEPKSITQVVSNQHKGHTKHERSMFKGQTQKQEYSTTSRIHKIPEQSPNLSLEWMKLRNWFRTSDNQRSSSGGHQDITAKTENKIRPIAEAPRPPNLFMNWEKLLSLVQATSEENKKSKSSTVQINPQNPNKHLNGSQTISFPSFSIDLDKMRKWFREEENQNTKKQQKVSFPNFSIDLDRMRKWSKEKENHYIEKQQTISLPNFSINLDKMRKWFGEQEHDQIEEHKNVKSTNKHTAHETSSQHRRRKPKEGSLDLSPAQSPNFSFDSETLKSWFSGNDKGLKNTQSFETDPIPSRHINHMVQQTTKSPKYTKEDLAVLKPNHPQSPNLSFHWAKLNTLFSPHHNDIQKKKLGSEEDVPLFSQNTPKRIDVKPNSETSNQPSHSTMLSPDIELNWQHFKNFFNEPSNAVTNNNQVQSKQNIKLQKSKITNRNSLKLPVEDKDYVENGISSSKSPNICINWKRLEYVLKRAARERNAHSKTNQFQSLKSPNKQIGQSQKQETKQKDNNLKLPDLSVDWQKLGAFLFEAKDNDAKGGGKVFKSIETTKNHSAEKQEKAKHKEHSYGQQGAKHGRKESSEVSPNPSVDWNQLGGFLFEGSTVLDENDQMRTTSRILREEPKTITNVRPKKNTSKHKTNKNPIKEPKHGNKDSSEKTPHLSVDWQKLEDLLFDANTKQEESNKSQLISRKLKHEPTTANNEKHLEQSSKVNSANFSFDWEKAKILLTDDRKVKTESKKKSKPFRSHKKQTTHFVDRKESSLPISSRAPQQKPHLSFTWENLKPKKKQPERQFSHHLFTPLHNSSTFSSL